MRTDTKLVHFEACPGDPHRPTSTPIYQTSTFAQPSATECGEYDYSRSGNPTRSVLERQLAEMEGGAVAHAFSSGMTAIGAVCRLVRAGSTILAGCDLYGGTYRLLTRVLTHQGVAIRTVDTTDTEAVERELERAPCLVLVESPTNPLQQVTDLAWLADRAHASGALLAVDNSLMSPMLQQPLKLGADLVVHSATKYLCGHSDVTGGVVVARQRELGERIGFLQNAEGTGLGPFDAWLLLRGTKTLAVRLARQQDNARRVAAFLAAQPGVTRVHYPGLTTHPGHELHARQAEGPGALVSFETGSVERSRRLVEATRLFQISVSFGSVTSLISLPCRMSHASIPADVRAERRLPEDLVRLSVGIEDADDLLEDLASALACVEASDSPGCGSRWNPCCQPTGSAGR